MGKKAAAEDIVTLVASLPDGTHIVEHQDGRLERRKSETDWERLKALTDEDIEASVAGDPDADEAAWSNDDVVVSKKRPISIRLDEDVLDFFKKRGAGYQKRINAVLRSYMNASSKDKRRA
jgi:uncharacterized protein (DUF4415 family)